MAAILQTTLLNAFSCKQFCTLFKKIVPNDPTDNEPTLIQFWRQTSDKPLAEPLMTKITIWRHYSRPKWVNIIPFNSLRVSISRKISGIFKYCNSSSPDTCIKIIHDDVTKWKHFPVTGGFSSQRPVTWSFDVFLDLRLNKRLSKHFFLHIWRISCVIAREWMPKIPSQYWLSKRLGAVRQQAIIWATVVQYLRCHTASLEGMTWCKILSDL